MLGIYTRTTAKKTHAQDPACLALHLNLSLQTNPSQIKGNFCSTHTNLVPDPPQALLASLCQQCSAWQQVFIGSVYSFKKWNNCISSKQKISWFIPKLKYSTPPAAKQSCGSICADTVPTYKTFTLLVCLTLAEEDGNKVYIGIRKIHLVS